MKVILSTGFLATVLATNAFAGEKKIHESRRTETAKVEIGQAFAVGSPADIWAQSSISIQFQPALDLNGVLLETVSAGVEGSSEGDANYINAYFDEGSKKIDFEIMETQTIRWSTPAKECFKVETVSVKIINNKLFQMEGFGGTQFDAYGDRSETTTSIDWQSCLELLRSNP